MSVSGGAAGAAEVSITSGSAAIIESTRYPGLAGTNEANLVIAEERFAEALAGGTELCFGSLDLVSLPVNLGDCTALESLDCKFDKLEFLPESIGRCVALKWLYCDDNALKNLPASLGGCIALEILYCRANKLEYLPESLGSCTALTEIDCCYNNLAMLPASLELCSLVVIYCIGNPWSAEWLKDIGISSGEEVELTALKAWAQKLRMARVKAAR